MSIALRLATINGRSLKYVETGNGGSSDVLVMVHAFPLGIRMWAPQMDAFDDWRVVFPALAGFDDSDPPSDGIDGYARDVLALLTALGIERAVFCGLSMGGYVTFGILREQASRVAGLILADTRSGPDSEEAREGRRRMLDVLVKGGPPAVAEQMVPKLLGATTLESRPELVADVRQMIEAQGRPAIASALRALMSRPDSTPQLGRIQVPTLIVVGEEDTLTPPAESERMQAAVRGARLERMLRAGHMSNLENPDAFNAAVRAFLDERRT